MEATFELLREWYERIQVSQKAHHFAAARCDRSGKWLGITTIVLTSVAGTTLFANLDSSERYQDITRLIVGLLSVAAAVFASPQTFLGYSEKSEKHRAAAAKYGAVGREIELALASPEFRNFSNIESIRTKIDSLAIETPNAPISLYRRAWANVEKYQKPK